MGGLLFNSSIERAQMQINKAPCVVGSDDGDEGPGTPVATFERSAGTPTGPPGRAKPDPRFIRSPARPGQAGPHLDGIPNTPGRARLGKRQSPTGVLSGRAGLFSPTQPNQLATS